MNTFRCITEFNLKNNQQQPNKKEQNNKRINNKNNKEYNEKCPVNIPRLQQMTHQPMRANRTNSSLQCMPYNQQIKFEHDYALFTTESRATKKKKDPKKYTF